VVSAAALHRMVVPHGENFSLGRNLTVWSTDADSTPGLSAADSRSSLASRAQAVWSPEVAFVYRPNNLMLESCFFHGKWCSGQPSRLHILACNMPCRHSNATSIVCNTCTSC